MSCDICDARATIQSLRVKRGMTVHDAAKALQISPRLLEEIEAGGFTHPKIAERIQKMFGLTDYETQQLISPKHEPIKRPKWNEGRQVSHKADDASNEYWNYKSQCFKGQIKKGAFGT